MTRLKIILSAVLFIFSNLGQATTVAQQKFDDTKTGHQHSEEAPHAHTPDAALDHNATTAVQPSENVEHDQAGGVRLTPTQMRLANVQISPLVKRTYQAQLYAPGEIKANGYNSHNHSN